MRPTRALVPSMTGIVLGLGLLPACNGDDNGRGGSDDSGDGADAGGDGADAGGDGADAGDGVGGQEPGPVASLADANAIFEGDDHSSRMSTGMAPAGDIDGDGLDDLWIGAPHAGWPDQRGKVYLFLGGDVPPADGPTVDLANAALVLEGEENTDGPGTSLAHAGDVDGDGLPDLLIGAPYNDEAELLAGKVHLVLGSTVRSRFGATLPLTESDYGFLGETTAAYSGVTVAGVGDVDGDGLDDLFVGSQTGTQAGAAVAHLVLADTLDDPGGPPRPLASADLRLLGEHNGDAAGRFVAAAGDVDGDGLADLLTSAINSDDHAEDAGKALLFLGGSLVTGPGEARSIADADQVITGAAAGEKAGMALAGRGDLDGDGLSDVVISTPHATIRGPGSGRVGVFWGSTLSTAGGADLTMSDGDLQLLGNEGDVVGLGLAFTDDVDGDGRPEVLVGTTNIRVDDEYRGGAFWLYSGTLSASGSATYLLQGADLTVTGAQLLEDAGRQVVGAGDIDGDGRGDALIGSSFSRNDAQNVGRAYLLLGGP